MAWRQIYSKLIDGRRKSEVCRFLDSVPNQWHWRIWEWPEWDERHEIDLEQPEYYSFKEPVDPFADKPARKFFLTADEAMADCDKFCTQRFGTSGV